MLHALRGVLPGNWRRYCPDFGVGLENKECKTVQTNFNLIKGLISMIEQDTIKLLRECDAGVKMGVASIDDVLDQVHSGALQQYLTECKKEHQKLRDEIQTLLEKYHDDGKEPNPIAKGMSWMKTSMKMGIDHSDQTIADLMTDGCNMGVKSLNKYLNQYEAADEVSKDIAKRLINLEEQLAVDIRKFL